MKKNTMEKEVLICSKCDKEIQSDQHYEDNHDGTYTCIVCSIQEEDAYLDSCVWEISTECLPF